MNEVPFGGSCYDPVIMEGPWDLDWHYHYRFAELEKQMQDLKEFANSIRKGYSISQDFPYYVPPVLTPEEYRYIIGMASIDDKTKTYDDEELISIAKQKAERDRKEFEFELQLCRDSRAQESLFNNLKYSALCFVCLSLIIRYLILLVKWLKKNYNPKDRDLLFPCFIDTYSLYLCRISIIAYMDHLYKNDLHHLQQKPSQG